MPTPLSIVNHPFPLRGDPMELDSPGCSSAADSECIKELKPDLVNAFTKSAVDSQMFLPADALDELTARERVIAELEAAELDDDFLDELADLVLEKAKRVFLILVYGENVAALPALLSEGFCDQHLPIGSEQQSVKKSPSSRSKKRILSGLEKERTGKRVHYVVGSLDEYSNTLKPRRWATFSTWESLQVEHFEKGQWLFLAPIFGENFKYRFHSNRPMPFLSKSNFPEKTGFFSAVYQVEIHGAHQQEWDGGGKLRAAVKELLPGMEVYYQKELDTLAVIRKLDHPYLIKPIATYQRGDAHCFLFPWADGDNLRQFWKEADKDANNMSKVRAQRNPELIMWVLEQMCGLADGLHALYERNCRHGDLKPENILRFIKNGGRGNLLIADMGLAKFHILATQQRAAQSSTSEGTFRYAPPEIDDKRPDKPLSRAYDVWSMGCIYLEFLIWLLGGQAWLKDFNKAGSGGFEKFWDFKDNDRRYQVHSAVSRWINRLSKQLRCDDPRVDTALKAILQLVKARLLLVSLEGEDVPEEDVRANASELYKSVEAIWDRAKRDPNYLFDASIWRQTETLAHAPSSLELPKRTDIPQGFVPPLPHASSSNLDDDGDFQVTVSAAPFDRTDVTPTSRQAVQEYQLSKLNDDWESRADNKFARDLLNLIGWSILRPTVQEATLCSNCKDLDIWSPGFKIARDWSELMKQKEKCEVCEMLYQSIIDLGKENAGEIQFLREGSGFKTESNGLPVLSIYADPGKGKASQLFRSFSFIRSIRVSMLPEQGSAVQFTLLNEWLRVCDESHDCQSQRAKEGRNFLPTRVINVGDRTNAQLRLLDGDSKRQGRYIALSHRWGKLDEEDKFCTYKRNIAEFRERIDFESLPRTFQDAVNVARGLNVQFLWIDSICIIQDDPQDWEAESERMEDVFSSAYCTIAATSAKSSVEGFLNKRKRRDVVTLRSAKLGTIYICKAIDNFQADVEQGELNKRGWVLQERALSHRSIHFTSTQVYWECGKNVHCETLATLHNSMAAFLGDSDFPKSALGYFKGGRIVLFQRLYEMYSRLAFTKEQDRSVAISGLEKRLVRDFKTTGGYGIFDAYLARALLWRRPEGSTLTRINYPPDIQVPSWSWMAYSGPIGYITIPFSGANWTKDFRTPFVPELHESSKSYWRRCENTEGMSLPALARKLTIEDRVEMMKRVRFDDNSDFDIESLRCVVIGKERLENESREPLHYVLVIMPITKEDLAGDYERVGAGYLQSMHVADTGAWVRIR